MVRAVRRKRASEETLYRGCLAGQDCPPDIKNKFEQNTIADKILKWVSSFLFFGQLGISSGKGTGGTGGYTRLGTTPEIGGGRPGVTTGRGSNVARPTVIVDALPPPGIPIDPTAPDLSVVPLLEDTVSTDIGAGEIEVIAEVHPPPTNGNDGIVIGLDPEPPVLEITPEEQPASRVRTTSSKHNNPAFTAYVASTQLPAETSASDHVYIMHGFQGEIIGPPSDTVFEEIPLEEFHTTAVDSENRTSTPDSSFRRVLNKFQRRLYNRRLVQQVKLTDRTFLTKPSQLVSWEFENPVFDEDISLIFEQDVEAVQAAPNPDFQDIVYLSRPTFEEREGYVRVSRLGRRGTIQTRSGATIGGHVHYYTDISPIRDLQDIEMQTFANTSGDSIIMQPLNESTVIDAVGDIGVIYDPREPLLDEQYSESALDDRYLEDFSQIRLQMTTEAEDEPTVITVQEGIPPGSVKLFINDTESVVHYVPTDTSLTPIIPSIPTTTPAIIIDFSDSTATFYLHPSLLKRKRKRRFF
ncbi:L2 minor capsid protein [Bos taurus papillomavirus 41]|nr:L2 minor capsid protein [Bos taurus papillomavirus 41]